MVLAQVWVFLDEWQKYLALSDHGIRKFVDETVLRVLNVHVKPELTGPRFAITKDVSRIRSHIFSKVTVE